MPAVQPTFAEHLSWLVPLNVGDDLDGLERYVSDNKLLPTANMVADGRRLVVKSGPILEALDADTFEVLWRREPSESKDESAIIEEPVAPFGIQMMDARQGEANDRFSGNVNVRRLVRDYVGSGLTIAGNLVCTVEWLGDPPNTMPWMDPQMSAFMMNTGFSTTHPNRIVACALADGKPVWETAPRPGENNLGWVEFLAPVPAEGVLLCLAGEYRSVCGRAGPGHRTDGADRLFVRNGRRAVRFAVCVAALRRRRGRVSSHRPGGRGRPGDLELDHPLGGALRRSGRPQG